MRLQIFLFLRSYCGLRYWVIRKQDADHAILAGEHAPPEQRDEVIGRRLAAAGAWRWRWQRKDGSPRWRRC